MSARHTKSSTIIRMNGGTRWSPIWKLSAFSALLALSIFAIQLYLSSFGRFMPAVHGDWASHASTTRAIFLDEDFSSDVIKSTLNEFAFYPRLSYYAAAITSHIFDVSPLQGLTIIAIFSVILACLALALRLQNLILDRKPSLYYVSFALLYIGFGVYIFELGFRDLAISNSFLSQLVSIALAQLSIYLARNIRSACQFLVLALVSAFVLINTHIIGFIWCLASMIIMSLGFQNLSFRYRIVLIGLISLIAATFFFTSPGVLEMANISGTGGDLRAWNGKNLSDYPSIFIALISVYFLSIGLVFYYWKKGNIGYSDVFRNGAGFITLGPLILASAATVFIKGGNWYPVVKWLYLFFPEFLIFVIFFFSNAKSFSVTSRSRTAYACGLLCMLFVVQAPYFVPKIDLTPAIEAEDGIVESVDIDKRRYPALQVDHPALNYFIARSVLKIPTDALTIRWMNNDYKPTDPLFAEDFLSAAPHLAPSQIIHFTRGNRTAQRMLTNKWWGLEAGHVWASHTPATIFFLATEVPKSIRLSFVPYISAEPMSRVFLVVVNDVQMPEISASKMNWAQPVTHSIQIPPGVIRADGRVKITISWAAVAEKDLGFALTSLEYK